MGIEANIDKDVQPLSGDCQQFVLERINSSVTGETCVEDDSDPVMVYSFLPSNDMIEVKT